MAASYPLAPCARASACELRPSSGAQRSTASSRRAARFPRRAGLALALSSRWVVAPNAKNPEEARPKPCPLGVLAEVNLRSLLSERDRFPGSPGCSTLVVGRSLGATSEPAALGRSRGPRTLGSRSPVGVGHPPCGGSPVVCRRLGSSSRPVPSAEAAGCDTSLLAPLGPVSRWPSPEGSGLPNPSGLRPPSKGEGIHPRGLMQPDGVVAFRALRRLFAYVDTARCSPAIAPCRL